MGPHAVTTLICFGALVVIGIIYAISVLVHDYPKFGEYVAWVVVSGICVIVLAWLYMTVYAFVIEYIPKG